MKEIYWGNSVIRTTGSGVSGGIVEIDGEAYYRIANHDQMPPFLMSVVSSSDHWLFISSTGGITCGRGEPDRALFPYETDDKIHDAPAHTGPLTCILAGRNHRKCLWKPFSSDVAVYDIQRNLYKSLVGDRLIFEEINKDLDLAFEYSWSTSDRFGFVKATTLRNTGEEDISVEVLDGVRNLLPSGISHEMQSLMSTLVDAYKKAEIDEPTGAGIFSLSSIPTDRAEPCESLKATVAWWLGPGKPTILLSDEQVEAFCAGQQVQPELAVKGRRCAYFVRNEFAIPAGKEVGWHLLTDVDQGPSDLPGLLAGMAREISGDDIEADVRAGTQRLVRLVSDADGCQVTSDELVSGRHFANTLFNIMRGGTFSGEYRVRHDDFLDFVTSWNVRLRAKFSSLLAGMPDPLARATLLAAVESDGDSHMTRLAQEYLPLSFSRRHGDPSRPWNKFRIDIKTAKGKEKLYYQGNWRDIFQNWEALAVSYPEFIDSFIAKFVNASTVDGHNPYRISRDGIDWEVPEPGDAWSNFGYWGDHQVNYLSRLLELSQQYYPERITQLLSLSLFVYADVPYRLRDYKSLLDNPRDSVVFDHERNRLIADKAKAIGADGKLVTLGDGSIYQVNLLEKLLVTVLCKLGNLVPGGGIWMNTQRPEWNDANNALAGFGLSMVTLCYLRRLLVTMKRSISRADAGSFTISPEVLQFFNGTSRVLADELATLNETVSEAGRKQFMDRMGALASIYREQVYKGFAGKRSTINKADVLAFMDNAVTHLDHSLEVGRRPDGLFHSYNLAEFSDSGVAVRHLAVMLEGQVAALSSGYLEPRDGLTLLDALRTSSLYRSDQHSYLLYPDVEQPSFLERNLIPDSLVDSSELLQRELESGRHHIVERDVHGRVHFSGEFRHVDDLRNALEVAGDTSEGERAEWCDIFEAIFRHRAFTGRSSTMFKYEGLGCIYWHMVSKLVLAVSEFLDEAREDGVDDGVFQRLSAHFHDVRAGLGLYKSPLEYGAVPLDPYSHSPGFAGAQQPGMTGQVKEDFLTRFRELGVAVKAGTVSFDPYLLKHGDFVSESTTGFFASRSGDQEVGVEAGSLAFSLCGTPVIYRLAESCSIHVHMDDEKAEIIGGLRLDKSLSRSIFQRENRIHKLVVHIPRNQFY